MMRLGAPRQPSTELLRSSRSDAGVVAKIETGRYSELLRRILGMKGQEFVASELSPEISPAFILEAELPEWQFLRNQKLMGVVYALPAVAAQNSVVHLVNPAGSGVLATVVRSIYSAVGDTSYVLGRGAQTANLGTVLPSVARDTRFPIVNASALIASQGNNVVGAGEAFHSTGVLSLTPDEFTDPVVLTPAHQFEVSSISTNVAIRGAIQWLERRMDVLEQA